MDLENLLILVDTYRKLPRRDLLDLITDLVDMAREQSSHHDAHNGPKLSVGLGHLASFADAVAGYDALTAAQGRLASTVLRAENDALVSEAASGLQALSRAERFRRSRKKR